MEKSYQKLIQGNKLYAETRLFQDPDYFKKLSKGQTPTIYGSAAATAGYLPMKLPVPKAVKYLYIAILPTW